MTQVIGYTKAGADEKFLAQSDAVETYAPLDLSAPESQTAIDSALAANPTVTAAAAAAVATAGGVQSTAPQSDIAFSVQDNAGNASWVAVSPAGGLPAHSAAMIGTAVTPTVQAAMGVTDTSEASGYAYAVQDANGQVSDIALDTLGQIPAAVLARWAGRWPAVTRSRLDQIACYGDSVTQSGHTSGTYPGSTTWETYLAGLRPSPLTILNRGISGQESGDIGIRQGGIKLTATAGFTIPSGSTSPITVTVTASATTNARASGYSVSIGGIAGTLAPSGGFSCAAGPLTNSDNGGTAITWTFTPTGTPAANVNVAAGAQFVSSTAVGDQSDFQIIWAGRNDIAFGFPHVVDGAVAAVKAMVAYLSAQVVQPRFIVMGVWATGAYDDYPALSASANNAGWIAGINAQLAAAYPNNFLDITKYVVTNATTIAASAGLTFTANDLTAIADGFIPSDAFTVDGLHPNDPVRHYGIGPAIQQFMALRGW